MARHQKELTKKQKIIMYAAVATASVAAAVCAVVLVIHTVKNPPPVVLNSAKSAFSSAVSVSDTSSNQNSQSKPNNDNTQNNNSVISGITDGASYFTTQCAYVNDKNVDFITLNGVEVNNAFLIEGNSENTHRIVITYLDGTKKEFTVYTKPILSMLEQLDGINEYTATANNIEAINSIKKSAQSLSRKYSPYQETKDVYNVISSCDLMLEKIEEAARNLEEIKKSAEKFEGRELTSTDITDIVKLQDDISQLNTTKNLTESQLSELSDIGKKCTQWLSSIQSEE